jgi:DNA-binding GntR family transcriptional regulator
MDRMIKMDGLDGLVLRRVSTAQQVADGMSQMILNGNIAPGSPLRESAMAATLGISRNTVREAVRILEQGGLVRRPEMHRGAFVVEPSDEELADLYRARLKLEVAAAGETNAPESDDDIRTAFAAMVEACELHQLELIVERDLALHAAIVRRLGSRRIDSLFEQLALQLRFFLMVLSVEDREYESPELVITEHEQIVNAILSKNYTAAQLLVADMINVNEARVRSIFRKRASSPSSRSGLLL